MEKYSFYSLAVSVAAEEAFVDRLAGIGKGTVWVSVNCVNWFIDHRTGQLSATWPDWPLRFKNVYSEFDVSVYHAAKQQAAALV